MQRCKDVVVMVGLSAVPFGVQVLWQNRAVVLEWAQYAWSWFLTYSWLAFVAPVERGVIATTEFSKTMFSSWERVLILGLDTSDKAQRHASLLLVEPGPAWAVLAFVATFAIGLRGWIAYARWRRSRATVPVASPVALREFENTTVGAICASSHWLIIRAHVVEGLAEHCRKAATLSTYAALKPLMCSACPYCLSAVVAAVEGDSRVIELVSLLQKESGEPNEKHSRCCPFAAHDETPKWFDYSYYQHALMFVFEVLAIAGGRQSPIDANLATREGKRLNQKNLRKKFTNFMSATWEMQEGRDPQDRVNIMRDHLDGMQERLWNLEANESDDPRDQYHISMARAEYSRAVRNFDNYMEGVAHTEGRAGQQQRQQWQEASANLRREAGAQVDEAGTREAPSRTVLYNDDVTIKRVPLEQVAELHAEAMHRSQIARIAHDKEVAARSVVVGAREAPVPNVVAEGKKRGRQKEKWVVKRESAMANSAPFPFGGNSVLIIRNEQDHRMGLYSQCDLQLCVGTCRHFRNKENTADVDDCYNPNEMLTLHFPSGQVVKAMVMARWSPSGTDEVWYKTDVPVGQLNTRQKPVLRTPGEADIATSIVMYSGALVNGKANWSITHGVISRVVEKQSIGVEVGYDATTFEGYCRTPVYDARGRVIAGHLYGGKRDGNGTPYNAGESYHLPQNNAVFKEAFRAREFEAFPARQSKREGTVVSTPGLLSVDVPMHKRMSEPYKIWPLRKDKKLAGVNFAYHLMKPSCAMNKKEVMRFGDELRYATDKDLWKTALLSAVYFDAETGGSIPFNHPNEDNLYAMVDQLNDDRKSAGHTAGGATHKGYLLDLGDGDEEAGKIALVNRCLLLYGYMCGHDKSEAAQGIWFQATHWNVMGKKDGYKAKKLDIGRTIQCPCLEMKVLWKVCFGEADRAWVKKESWVHAGIDFDRPVTGERLKKIERSLGAGALDATAFDRYMEPQYIDTFFSMHMTYMAPGAPVAFMERMAEFVKSGPLVMGDGTVFFKSRGNPSGFMNTLRLNCWANLVAWCYCIARRMKEMQRPCEVETIKDILENHLYAEICGDDSRFWALTEFGLELLDLKNDMKKVIRVWNEELPWDVKLEGCAWWDSDPTGRLTDDSLARAPSMVSRCLFRTHDIMWESLCNVSRCLKRVCHDDNRTAFEEAELMEAAYATLAVPIFLYTRGLYRSAPLEAFLQDFPDERCLAIATNRASELFAFREGYRPRAGTGPLPAWIYH